MQDQYEFYQIAKIFSVNIETVRRWARKGYLKTEGVKSTKRNRSVVLGDELKRFLVQNSYSISNKSYIYDHLSSTEFCDAVVVADAMNLNRNTVIKYIHNNKICAFKVGGVFRIPKSELSVLKELAEKEAACE